MAKYKIIGGHDIGAKIAAALGLEHTRRIILDIGMDQPTMVYVELIADERLYDIDFSDLKIKIEEKQE